MPTYLLHGFRWPRNLIRIHIILQNLDDAAAEWLMAPATTKCLAANLKTLHPKLLSALPKLRFIEQFDPKIALSTPGGNVQPYAYVADAVEEVRLGVEVGEVMSRGVGNEAWAALTELRDQIAPGERVGWFVVVCQDTERHAPKANKTGGLTDEDEGHDQGLELADASTDGLEAEQLDVQMQALKMDNGPRGVPRPRAKSFVVKRKSSLDLRKRSIFNGVDRPVSAGNPKGGGGDFSRSNTSSGQETTTTAALPQQRRPKLPKKVASTPKLFSSRSTTSVNSMATVRDIPPVPVSPRSSGVRKWFNGLGTGIGTGLGVPLKKARSLKDLRKLEAEKSKEMAMPPPLPGTAV